MTNGELLNLAFRCPFCKNINQIIKKLPDLDDETVICINDCEDNHDL